MKDFKNQVAIITGASSGIGESIARILAKNRTQVVLAARRQERLSAIVEDMRADNTEVIAVPTDVRDRASEVTETRAWSYCRDLFGRWTQRVGDAIVRIMGLSGSTKE